MYSFDHFADFTPVSEEEFDHIVKRVLNDEEEDVYEDEKEYEEEEEYEELEWTIEGQKILSVMAPAMMSYVNFAMNYNDYMTDEPYELNEMSIIRDKYVIHPHDIMLDDYMNIEPISFIQFRKMIKDIEEPNVPVLALSYKNGSFNVNVIEYTSNHEKYKEAYKTGNIALYFLPRTIKRLSGNASANGKDIIVQFNNRLIESPYSIKSKKIIKVDCAVTYCDAECIAKTLRKINDSMHE